MKLPEKSELIGWHPLTPRSVAAFARASWPRLLLVQFVFALLAAAAVVWFLRTAWYPTIRESIRHLPERGEIRAGRLDWPGKAQLLAEGSFLAVVVDPGHSAQLRSPAHVQVEFGTNNLRVLSLLGYIERPYPRDRTIPFNQPSLEPRWGAWQAPILWITTGLVIAGLLLIWTVVATLFALPVWILGFFANRDLSLGGSWKLSGAALMPGALLMTAGILAYGIGLLDVVALLTVCVLHFVVDFFYLTASPLCAPKLEGPRKNPFAPGGEG